MICTPGTRLGHRPARSTSCAKTGYIETPDGNSVFMWSYATGATPASGHFQSPGPVLCANQGETVTSCNLHNNARPSP